MCRIYFKIFLILLFFTVPMQAYSQEWVFITELDGRKHFIDSASISEKSGYKWANHKSQYEKQQTGEDYQNKKTYKYITTNSLLAFNCDANTLIPVKTAYFSKDGKQVNEINFTTEEKVIEGDKQWELDNNPETFRSSIIAYVCK